MIPPFGDGSKHGAGAPCGVPKHEQAVMGLTEKIHKPRPSLSYSPVGREFSVHESTIYIRKVSLTRNTHKTS